MHRSLMTLFALYSCLFLVLANAASIQDGDDDDDYGRRQADNLTKLEAKMNHRIHSAERRLTWRFSRLLKRQNRTSLAMEGDIHDLKEELRETRSNADHRAGLVRRLERRVAKQQRELHKTKASLRRLQATVANLTRVIARLVEAKAQPIMTTETPKPTLPVDCQDAYLRGGMTYSGDLYTMVQPNRSRQAFRACCMLQNRKGWTVIQRRNDGSVDFYRNWNEYKLGFGKLEGDFWLGNEHIHQLTKNGDYKLRLEITDWDGNDYWAEYHHFRLSDEKDKYRLRVHGYSGNAGDSLTSEWENHDGKQFSTMDNDNDGRFYDNCAEMYHGAWWFGSCFESHLNGVYYHRGTHSDYFVRNGIQWNSVHLHSSLKSVKMMIMPNSRPDSAIVDITNNHIQ